MHYVSTRGNAPELPFDEVVLAGLASDGGLYVPAQIPQVSPQTMADWAQLSYADLAFEVMKPFVAGTVADADLKAMIDAAYAEFRHTAIAPLKQLGDDEWLLELFHGPTLAFKDFALQFLGRLIDHILSARGEKGVVVGATSGDTGSAAIAGFRGRDNMDICILYPHGRVSDVQRRQMTTVADANVHCIALHGTFDDCQDHVKTLFGDAEFRKQHRLLAVNSINWARILAQVVYYFYAALRLGAPARVVNFCVPTGNFGDIFAGYIARRMGLPVGQLVIASNRNDILTRCLRTGSYSMAGVEASLSPSMDIEISSNFERLLFDLHGRDGAKMGEMMTRFRSEKSLTLDADAYQQFQKLFAAERIDDAQTKAIIKELYETTGELLDPHTAVGVGAARACRKDRNPMVTLSTAHPAKFPDAVKDATGKHPDLPAHMGDLFDLPERFTELENDLEAVKAFVANADPQAA